MNCFSIVKFWCVLALSMLTACSSSKALAPLHVFSVVDQAHVGDNNQIKGVIAALQQHTPRPIVVREQLNDMSSVYEKATVLIAGAAGLKQFVAMPVPSGVKCWFLTHQAPADLEALSRSGIDILALPTHAVSHDIEAWAAKNNIVLVPTVGVAHNTSIKTVTDAYQAAPDLIKVPKPYLGVMLGGDAPEADGSMRYYTVAEAQAFAVTIAGLAKQQGASVLVLNGPRTGKFDPATGKECMGAHRNGVHDKVTQAFMQALDAQGLHADERVQLLDFQFGQPSCFHAVLGAIKATGGMIVVNGESTSMVAECTSVLEPHHVLLVTNDAMNATHHKHVQQECAAGRAGLLNSDGSVACAREQAVGYASAADHIASVILAGVK